VVLPGIEIGSGCVVGAGGVVARSLPPDPVAVGNPARVIKDR
jgi:maltose O-acetyltransferase